MHMHRARRVWAGGRLMRGEQDTGFPVVVARGFGDAGAADGPPDSPISSDAAGAGHE